MPIIISKNGNGEKGGGAVIEKKMSNV